MTTEGLSSTQRTGCLFAAHGRIAVDVVVADVRRASSRDQVDRHAHIVARRVRLGGERYPPVGARAAFSDVIPTNFFWQKFPARTGAFVFFEDAALEGFTDIGAGAEAPSGRLKFSP